MAEDIKEITTEASTSQEDIEEIKPPKKLNKNEYIEGLGRRKRSVARVRIYSSTPAESIEKKGFTINDTSADDYFLEKYKEVALSPLSKLNMLGKFRLSVKVNGGGITGQAGAVKMGLARALIIFDPTLRAKLKRLGYLTRDPREKERKKPGLKKARRAPQWRKR